MTILGHLEERASRHPPPTHHPPSTHGPTQYSNAAVRRAIHLTGEQQPIRGLQSFRAGRDLQLSAIPRHAGSQAKSARVADSAHGDRRRLDAAVIGRTPRQVCRLFRAKTQRSDLGPGVVVLAVDAGALVVSCPWLKWPKSNSKVYCWNSGKKKKRAATKKKRGGASEPSPGGRFPRLPLAEVGHRRPFFRRHVVVLLCGWDVAAP